jgi:hypothetical protein
MSEGIDRRTTLGLLGVASVSALGAGVAHAQSQTQVTGSDVEQLAEGVEMRVIGEGKSTLPGFAKVRVLEITYQPGSRTESTMENPMICHTASGTLKSTVDGEVVADKEGSVWSCNTGMKEVTLNEGAAPAVMMVSEMLPG